MLDSISRTCAAGLRPAAFCKTVRPAKCKRSPLTGFALPNVGHSFPFLFLFPRLSFQSHIFLSRSRQPCSSHKGALQLPQGVTANRQPSCRAFCLSCVFSFFFCLSSVANLNLFCARWHNAQVASCAWGTLFRNDAPQKAVGGGPAHSRKTRTSTRTITRTCTRTRTLCASAAIAQVVSPLNSRSQPIWLP